MDRDETLADLLAGYQNKNKQLKSKSRQKGITKL